MKKIYIVRMTKYKIFNQDAICAISQGTLMKFMSFYQVKTTVDLVKFSMMLIMWGDGRKV